MLVRRYVSFFDPTIVGMDVKCLKGRLRMCGVHVEFVTRAAKGGDKLRAKAFLRDRWRSTWVRACWVQKGRQPFGAWSSPSPGPDGPPSPALGRGRFQSTGEEL